MEELESSRIQSLHKIESLELENMKLQEANDFLKVDFHLILILIKHSIVPFVKSEQQFDTCLFYIHFTGTSGFL